MTVGYSDEFRRQREAAQAAEARQREQWARDNAEARKRYLAKLDAERQAKNDAHAAEEERQLAPIKAERRRAWLIEHPGFDAAHFDKHVWPLMKAEYTSREARVRREIEIQRQRGR